MRYLFCTSACLVDRWIPSHTTRHHASEPPGRLPGITHLTQLPIPKSFLLLRLGVVPPPPVGLIARHVRTCLLRNKHRTEFPGVDLQHHWQHSSSRSIIITASDTHCDTPSPYSLNTQASANQLATACCTCQRPTSHSPCATPSPNPALHPLEVWGLCGGGHTHHHAYSFRSCTLAAWS